MVSGQREHPDQAEHNDPQDRQAYYGDQKTGGRNTQVIYPFTVEIIPDLYL